MTEWEESIRNEFCEDTCDEVCRKGCDEIEKMAEIVKREIKQLVDSLHDDNLDELLEKRGIECSINF